MSSISGISGYDINSLYGYDTNKVNTDTSADALTATLSNKDMNQATDEELMDVCKSFESYFVEQVMKEAKKTLTLDDENKEGGEYLQYFGDALVQEYSDVLTEHGDLGIAQKLYDSMKRNGL